jgi:hypothetical protein
MPAWPVTSVKRKLIGGAGGALVAGAGGTSAVLLVFDSGCWEQPANVITKHKYSLVKPEIRILI